MVPLYPLPDLSVALIRRGPIVPAHLPKRANSPFDAPHVP
jgi:hypothetical protein